MRFGGGPPPRSDWGVPNPFWATSAATRSIPLGVAGTAHWPLGRAWAGRPWRTGWPVVATVRSAERRPRDGAGLCVNAGKSGTGWLCAPAWSWPNGPPSTPAALTRCAPSQQRSDPGAQSAGPAAHRIPGARRWLICALYAARVRWAAVRVRSRRSWAHCPVAPGWMGCTSWRWGAFTCAAFARVTSPGARASMWKGRAGLQLPPRPLGEGATGCLRGLPTGRGGLWSWRRKRPGCSTTTTSARSTFCLA